MQNQLELKPFPIFSIDKYLNITRTLLYEVSKSLTFTLVKGKVTHTNSTLSLEISCI